MAAFIYRYKMRGTSFWRKKAAPGGLLFAF
jgi:hypothetical protein